MSNSVRTEIYMRLPSAHWSDCNPGCIQSVDLQVTMSSIREEGG